MEKLALNKELIGLFLFNKEWAIRVQYSYCISCKVKLNLLPFKSIGQPCSSSSLKSIYSILSFVTFCYSTLVGIIPMI